MSIKIIDAPTLNDWLAKKTAVLVDVREPEENDAENIPGAILIPLNTLSTKNLPETSNKKLVFHCKAGKRSYNACEKLVASDPSLEVYSLEGGIGAWEKAGYPVNKK
ncbi:rhodanese-like domain-containing protein [Legionella hackeliae]|uniref:Rhodanese domain protein n=1 Tax=Legionella hackeliae TaxID=449 RepID=A0A0A8USU7_LEGHA|nr:rhodanese-like domain-containing protein [Legionella hackeliae]KTD12531.1 Rhodanese domain protein [Legionella hackeliae]CEK11945.1 Rhodanese domain protein [Legionella hackeliae]STX48719.1 rhodanese domain-containing protein [Legionella hackeliae]